MKHEIAKTIRDVIKRASSPVVLFSGGMDSLLLVYLTRRYQLPIVTFTSDWTPPQLKALKRIASAWDLTVYGFPPSVRYCAAGDAPNQISLVDEYTLGGTILPVVRDVQPGSQCLADLSASRLPVFGVHFDTALVGVLESDRHPLTGNRAPIARDQTIGTLRIVAPLFDLTKEDIQEWITDLGIADFVIPDTGEIAACTKCLVGDTICPASGEWLKKIDWDGQQMAAAFRDKFGF